MTASQAQEITKLISSARDSNEIIQCYSGETRARFYTLSYFTGLRRKELGSLEKNNFDLDSPQPTVTVEAAFSKHRKKDVLPLHQELVPQIREWLKDIGRVQSYFLSLKNVAHGSA